MVQIHLGPLMADPVQRPDDVFDLLDWKRRIFELYGQIRTVSDARAGWSEWRAARDELFRSHPQSPLPEGKRATFEGLGYFDYDPAARVIANVGPAEPEHYDIATSGDGTYGFTRFASARGELYREEIELELYWLDGYGGGFF